MSELTRRIAQLSPEQRALLDRRLKASSPAAAAVSGGDSIAIVGIGCRFPGHAQDPDSFWRLLEDGVDAIREVPSDRWSNDALFDADPEAPGKISSRWGGFLDEVDRFDAAYFGISPREAARMDPQQRILLEVLADALDDAGLSSQAIAGSATGVFVGAHGHASDYLWLQYADPSGIDAFTGTGTAHNLLAGRASYLFDLHGPAVVVDTACSSSLVAVHLAVQSLRAGECQLALAAGVNLILAPHFSIAASRMHMLAPDGRCKAFDRRADGFVRSEGCGAVVLRRLADALADGDPIVAVLRGSAVNQDGHTNGVTAPNGVAQRQVIERALRDAGLAANEVGYVEAHGTGTSLGDPIEVEALGATVGRPRSDGFPCHVGSVKTNLGHLEGAAGIAGLIKAALVLRKGRIPGNLHFTGLNPHIDVRGTRLAFPTRCIDWVSAASPHVAGVSSFGWSGTNAHVVLESAPAAAAAAPAPAGPFVLPISARSPEALEVLGVRYGNALAALAPGELADLCYTAAARRSHHMYRTALVGDSPEALRAHLDASMREGLPKVPTASPRIVFVFPGQGSQWPGMARRLIADEPVFRDAIARIGSAIEAQAGWSLQHVLEGLVPQADADAIDVVQPTLFAIEVALAELWRSWGIVPDAVVGHSMGEVAAAHVAGALSLVDAVRIICVRSRLLRVVVGRGSMAMVELGAEDAQRACEPYRDVLSVAVINGPRSTVIAGDPAALEALLVALREQGVFCRSVKVDVASHSPQVDPLRAALVGELNSIAPSPVTIPIVSTVLGRHASGADLDAAYWADNLRRPVRFLDALHVLLADGCDAFVEMSPHPILLPAVEDAIGESGRAGVAVASMRRDDPERTSLRRGLAELYVRGTNIDWKRVWGARRAVVRLPAYPWQRERHWLEGLTVPAGSTVAPKSVPSLSHLRTRTWLYSPRWVERPDPGAVRQSKGLWLILSDNGGLGDALASKLEREGHSTWIARIGNEYASTGPRRSSLRPSAAADFGRLLDAVAGADAPVLGVVHLWNVDAPADCEDPRALESFLPAGVNSVVRLVQAMLERDVLGACRLTIVTRGAQSPDGRAPAPAQAPAWGLGRVLAEEHPELWGGLVDVDPGVDVATAAGQIGVELIGESGEDGVAYAGSCRYVLRLQPLDGQETRVLRCRPDSTYLVTGGLGGVGLESARWLIERGARHIVLAGRTRLPARRDWSGAVADPFRRQIDGVLRLEALGASVRPVALDVSDEYGLQSLLDQMRDESRPPLRGVIHAAAVSRDCLVARLDDAGIDEVLRPKIGGAAALARSPAATGLEFIVLYSSLGSLLGQPGQAAYAAANAYLDALAGSLRARGVRATSVNWGAWTELGLAQTEGARRTIDELDRRGIRGFTPDEGLDALGHVVDLDATCVAVAPADWKRFGEVAASTRVPSMVRELVQAPTKTTAVPAVAMTDRLAALDESERREVLIALLRDALASVLRLPAARIQTDQPMGTQGLESLTALELRKRLETLLGIRMSAAAMWNYPTLSSLAAYLDQRLGGAPVVQTEAPIPRREAASGGLVASVSDEEALRRLLDPSGGVR